ncbi:MAG TPA: hypothetical protein VFE46_13910 [Pirellulales bacterium]|jgi:hypothetical protein|nr:hypothetical protein [Pirellulales bacterium]
MVAAFFLATLIAAAYWACQQSPAFYDQSLVRDQYAVKEASDALLREAAHLASNLRRPGQWHALFTADQINGWLAYDVLQNHPHLFPPSVKDPRVSIENNRAQIAFLWRKFGWTAVVSLETEVYLRETNVVAIRICKARAGLLPLPLAGLLTDLIVSGKKAGLQIEAEQVEGDPLLVITMPWADTSGDKLSLSLESLEINGGEIFLAGHSQNGEPFSTVAQRPLTNREPIGHELASREVIKSTPSDHELPDGQFSGRDASTDPQRTSSAETHTETMNLQR